MLWPSESWRSHLPEKPVRAVFVAGGEVTAVAGGLEKLFGTGVLYALYLPNVVLPEVDPRGETGLDE